MASDVQSAPHAASTDAAATTAGTPGQVFLSIAAVERDTGISKETLRVWERRYGFPRPTRDEVGERVYPVDQVDRLRMIRRLVHGGFRPGKIVRQPLSHLMALSAETIGAQQPAVEPVAAEGLLDSLRQQLLRHRLDELRERLRALVLRVGLGRFVHEIALPLVRRLAQDSAANRVRAFEERLFHQMLAAVLRQAVEHLSARGTAPAVLLAGVTSEASGLSLLIDECLLRLEDCRCVSLGTNMPMWDVAMAADACAADIVLLQYGSASNPNAVADTVRELRAQLAPRVEIWIAGTAPVLRRKPPAHSVVVEALRELPRQVADWRARAAAVPGVLRAEAATAAAPIADLSALTLPAITGR